MPKASVVQTNFSAGEASPLVQGRIESPRYRQALAKCLNYIPSAQGPIIRRPGTVSLTAVKSSANPPVLVPFLFSTTQAYILEFGAQYVRFYANNGQIVTSGTSYQVSGFNVIGSNPNSLGSFWATRANTDPLQNEHISGSVSVSTGSVLELVTPYLSTDDLNQLRWAQSADTLYLFHPNHPMFKLQRYGQTYWTIKQVLLQDGPYKPANTVSTIGDAARFYLTTNTFTNSVLCTAGPSFTISNCTNDAPTGRITITTSASHNFTSGDYVCITGVVGTTEANTTGTTYGGPVNPAYWSITVTSSTTFILNDSTFTNAYSSGGTVYPGVFGPDYVQLIAGGGSNNSHSCMALVLNGQRYWGWSDGLNNGFQIFMIPNALQSVPTSATTSAWYLGLYGDFNYPTCGCFHQNRLVLAGSAQYPLNVSGSSTGSYEAFTPSDTSTLTVNDNNAFNFNLASKFVSAIRWMSSHAQGLLAGSNSSEFIMTPSSSSDGLTPTNFNSVETSFYGSAVADVVKLGNASLYIQRAQRKIREMNFFFQVGTFRSTDMTEISEHITIPTVTKLEVTKETQPIVWALRSDGQLISMVYNRDDVSLQAGWTRHQLGGQSDAAGTPPKVLSIAAIPSPDGSFDQLWMVVQRWINGAVYTDIEYLTKIFDDSFLLEDAYQFDCGFTFYNPKTITGVSTASTAVVTSASHGFSNGDTVKIVNVVGVNQSSTDSMGNTTTTSLVNEMVFTVQGVTTNTFQLYNMTGSPVSSLTYSSYISGGQVAKQVTTISGATWLKNETISVLADGANHPPVTVSSSGVITLQWAAAKVQFGYSYNSDGQLLRLEAGAADGTSLGKTRRTARAAFLLHNSGDLQMGMSFTNLIPLTLYQGTTPTPTPLFNGIVRDGVEAPYDFSNQLCFRQNTGLPGAVCAVTSFMEENDV